MAELFKNIYWADIGQATIDTAASHTGGPPPAPTMAWCVRRTANTDASEISARLGAAAGVTPAGTAQAITALTEKFGLPADIPCQIGRAHV